MKNKDKKRAILILRWTAIIVTSYLILLARGRVVDLQLSHLLIILYIVSNIALAFVPEDWFANLKLFYTLVLFDTALVSVGIYLSEKMATDFYLVFFLIIIFASISRNFKLLMVIGGATSLLYGIFLYSWGFFNLKEGSSYILRIPFIFVMTVFYGYLVKTLTTEKHQELTISEDKYKGLFENANDGIIILRSLSFQIADVNREVVDTTGYAKQELLEKEVISLFQPEEIEKARDYFRGVSENGEGRTDNLSLARKDGSLLEMDLSTKKIELGEDVFYQMIFRDLTEQRKLEKKIRESKRHLETIFDGIQDHLSTQSVDYRILRVNKMVIEKYQTTFNQLIGQKCYEAYFQKTQPCEGCPAQVTLSSKASAASIMKISDDTTLHVFSYPLLDEKGNLVSVIEYIKDITGEQRLQEQLIQSEKLAGIGILASGVAHEINNPLSGIVGMTEIALEEKEPLKIVDCLKDILQCAMRISEIVGGLRSYSRAAKKGELGFADLNEVLEESLRMVWLAAPKTSVEVIKDLHPLKKIQINTGEIQQVFTNLITNALQAMNGKEGKLTLSSRYLNNFIEVKVSDNGIGISEKHLSHIFDPFFTTKKLGEGTGLGLNIAYRIVTKYEGTIAVESKEQVGTTFTIRFPVKEG